MVELNSFTFKEMVCNMCNIFCFIFLLLTIYVLCMQDDPETYAMDICEAMQVVHVHIGQAGTGCDVRIVYLSDMHICVCCVVFHWNGTPLIRIS